MWTTQRPIQSGYFWVKHDSLCERCVIMLEPEGASTDDPTDEDLLVFVQEGFDWECMGLFSDWFSEQSNVEFQFICGLDRESE